MPYATIAALHIYPVKSCRGIPLQSANLQPGGLEGDRHWMVVNENGRYLTQRELPRMALIVPERTGGGLSLAAPGMPPLHLPEALAGSKREVSILFDRFEAFDAGPEPADWLSQFLAHPVRLVRFDPLTSRPVRPEFWRGNLETRLEFVDGFPLLILSQASLNDLNTRLDSPLPMNRFRPNVVLEGLEPYGEDRIHALVRGAVRLQMARSCTRCKITTTNQLTAEVLSAEPLTTLKTYRWSKELRGIMFGQYAVVADGAGTPLRIGDRLEIEWK